jgi:hypothetical protein
MKVLIACEESQVVCKAFRAKGHEAYSCDIIDCSGDSPEWHLKVNVLMLLEADWDMIIAFPPCTYLCNSGVRWLYEQDGRWTKMASAALLFAKILDNHCPKIAIENPVMHKHAKKLIGKGQDQIIQPWQFGHGETKATCLWLKGLPKLKPTNIVDGREARIHRMPPGPERSKLRSKTYQGIADAMADQWG